MCGRMREWTQAVSHLKLTTQTMWEKKSSEVDEEVGNVTRKSCAIHSVQTLLFITGLTADPVTASFGALRSVFIKWKLIVPFKTEAGDAAERLVRSSAISATGSHSRARSH